MAMITMVDRIALGWVALASLYTFVRFGWDKYQAGKPGKSRASEFHLALASALGGWPGGCLAMLLFRHKTAKRTFQLKFALAFAVWAGLLWAYWKARAFFR